MKKKIYAYLMLLTISLSVLSVNLFNDTTVYALTGANGNEIDNDHAPRSAILTATGSSISAYKAGWLPPVNTTGLVAYMQFYSRLDKTAVIELLQDRTKAELESYDTTKNSTGPNAAYLITKLNYADGLGNTFNSGQIEIQGAMQPVQDRDKYIFRDDNSLNYNFYVASIGANGIIGVAQINENAATNAAVTKNGISTINDYTVKFSSPLDPSGLSGYLVLYTTMTKENTLNALRSQSKSQLEALNTSNKAKLIPAASVDPSSGEIAFNTGQLPYNSGTFSTLTTYNVFVVTINNATAASVGVVGIAQAGVIAKVDATPAQSELIAPTEGELTDFYILFNKKMNSATTAITNVNDLLQSLEVVNGTETAPISLLGAASNSVRWLRPDIAKITLPPVNLHIGDQLKLTYASTVKDAVDVSVSSPALSPAALKDDAKPVGRIIQPTQQASLTSIVIRFNERMSSETIAVVQAKDFANKIDIITGLGKVKSTINLATSTVAWAGNIATVSIPATTISTGDLFRITYTDTVKDFFGNPASNEGTSAPIGGGFDLSKVDVHTSVLNEIRQASGGRTPTIAVLTSGSAGSNAADTYYKDVDDTPTGISYEKEFIRYGFNPVYIPVNNVNYQAQRNNPDVVALANEATVVYFNGGDQFRHAKSLFNDDGTDSLVLSSLKQIFYSGGTATGVSAGDHILSSPMHGGGDSYTDLNNNGMVVNSLSDETIGEGDRSGVMPGFGFISAYGMTDSHFDQRGRIGRLIVAMRETNQRFGFGIDENTSFIVSEGKGKAVGANGVFVVNASHALFSDGGTDSGKEFAATGIIVNYLSNGDQYDFTANTVISSKSLIETPSQTVYHSANIFNSLENTKVITTLADSAATTATGVSSQFKLIYSKDAATKGYKSGTKYTVSGMNLAINKYVRSITVDGLNLNPAYNLNTTEYNVDVEPSRRSVSINAAVDDASTALMLNGETISSGESRSLALNSGDVTKATLVATPAAGATKTYTLFIHSRPQSHDATLSDIQVGGKRLGEFSSSVASYNVELPAETKSVPTVTATASDTKAKSVLITPTEALPGTTTIEVTAEDGVTRKKYELHFTVKRPSSSVSTSVIIPDDKPVVEDHVFMVTAEMLHKAENGRTIITVSNPITELKLPSDSADLLGQNKLVVQSERLTLEIPNAVLRQLELKLSTEERSKGSISLKFEPLVDSDKKSLIAKSQSLAKAEIKTRGEVYALSLCVTDVTSNCSSLTSFDEPITLRLKASLPTDARFSGIYNIADDGILQYIGGKYVNGEMVAQLTHFSNYALLEMNKEFVDVPDGYWATAVIKEMAAKGVITGTGPDTFQPNRIITRAEFTALLARALKLTEKGTLTFTDVKSTDWYGDSISMAVKAGIVSGKSVSVFDPNGSITREEMAVMIVKAYIYVNGKPVETEGLSDFLDEAQVSKWAKEFVHIAEGLHLIQGRKQGLFHPQGYLNRAEAAQVIYNLLTITAV